MLKIKVPEFVLTKLTFAAENVLHLVQHTVACKLIRTRHIFTFSVIVGLTAAHTALIDICSTCNSIVEGR